LVPEAGEIASPEPGLAPAGAELARARTVFGSALPAAQRYAALLAGAAAERGLIGPAETGRIWERHILNCAAVAELIPRDGTVIDVGSGAGLPGIVLAILRPDARLTLLEPMARRVAFLLECVQILGLDNVTVLRGRAEELAGELTADVVTARAVAPLDRLAGLAAALVRPGGVVLAIKGQSAQAEVARAQPVLRRLGFRDVSVVTAGSGTVIPAVTVVRMVSSRPERLPSARRRVTGRAADRATGRAGSRRAAAGRGRAPRGHSGGTVRDEGRH
jgi:16S rRNA (guanine527-N7)-methyltransferase